jgi:hypothetical protein
MYTFFYDKALDQLPIKQLVLITKTIIIDIVKLYRDDNNSLISAYIVKKNDNDDGIFVFINEYAHFIFSISDFQ